MSITGYAAYVDMNDTKAILDGNVSKWSGEELIQIVGRKGSHKFGTSVSGAATSATFTYMGTDPFEEDEVLAVYPYGNAVYAGNIDEKYVTNVTVPSNQTPVAGSYDPNAAVAIAYSTNNQLKFKNAVALLKFTMGSNGVKNVTVWGDMSVVPGEGLPSYYEEGNIYLTIDPQWKSDGARFAAYFWNSGGGESWASMTEVAGESNLYTCKVPSGAESVIFCRMNGGAAANNWDNKWNQTIDLSLSYGNHFTITEPWHGEDDKATGSWSSFSSTIYAGISGAGTLHYNEGNPVLSGMSNGYVSMTGNFIKGRTYYIAVAPVVFEKGFTMEFSDVGDYDKYKVKSTSRKVEFKRNTIYDLGTIVSGKDTGFYTDPAIPNADEPCTVYFKPAKEETFYGTDSDLYAHVWLRNGAEQSDGSTWGDNSSKYKLTKVSGQTNLWRMEITPSVREWFGIGKDQACWKIGVLARSSDGKSQTSDYYIKVQDDLHEEPLMPEGLKHGINYIDNSTVTLVLYDRDNQGKNYDFCNLLWDENWWGYAGKEKKPLSYDDEAGCWWITLTGLNPNKQYKFQYQLGKGNNVWVTTFDPYTEILYDRSNDQWISDYAYPGLASEYGDSHSGRDNGFISAFKINRDVYNWQIHDYQIEDSDDLVIYELLVRDFTDNNYGEGSLRAIMEGQWQNGKNWLDYLKNLGVNAIELMPVQEFDGNNSWGYGTHAYFAMDKVYGNRATYKKFIDECHKRGMAVILDVVYNHATGAHPYAAMYWDGDKTASHNPWFNRDATHPYNVYHQWNHSNPMVREHVKRNLEYLIKEYKVDGFRFDLSKGFMGTSTNVDGYNSERVGYLKEYRDHIRKVDPNAVMICEHFVSDENYDLGHADIKVWQNMNEAYRESLMGWISDKSNIDGVQDVNVSWLPFGTYVGYMESHDEERAMYSAQEYGTESVKADYKVRLKRAGLNAGFFLLVPGPKMIWQFGELGYDYSITYNNDRTGKKPYVTPSYYNDANRKALYDTYAMFLKFRRDNPRFFDDDVEFSWGVGATNTPGRYMFAKNADGQRFALFGNVGSGKQTVTITLPHGGTWYDYNTGVEWKGANHSPQMSEGQFYILVNDKSMCL